MPESALPRRSRAAASLPARRLCLWRCGAVVPAPRPGEGRDRRCLARSCRPASGTAAPPRRRGFQGGGAAVQSPLRRAFCRPGSRVCRDAEDVSAAILWARENDVPLVARSGGHSYAGYSTTTGLMISLADLDAVSFDRFDRHRRDRRRGQERRDLHGARGGRGDADPWPLSDRRRGRIPARRRHRLQHAALRHRLGPTGEHRPRHRRRRHRVREPDGKPGPVLGLPRRRGRQFRHQHRVPRPAPSRPSPAPTSGSRGRMRASGCSRC